MYPVCVSVAHLMISLLGQFLLLSTHWYELQPCRLRGRPPACHHLDYWIGGAHRGSMYETGSPQITYCDWLDLAAGGSWRHWRRLGRCGSQHRRRTGFAVKTQFGERKRERQIIGHYWPSNSKVKNIDNLLKGSLNVLTLQNQIFLHYSLLWLWILCLHVYLHILTEARCKDWCCLYKWQNITFLTDLVFV